MSDKADIKPALLTLSLGVLTVILASVTRDSKLKSERPRHDAPEVTSCVGEQNVSARLWQDPFSVSKANFTNAASPQDLRWQLKYRTSQGFQVSLLGVFVEGTPYPEDFEVRLRLRYAVQTALLDSGFIPADRSHLGVTSLNWPKGRVIADLQRDGDYSNYLPKLDKPDDNNWYPLLVPFEWFIGNDSNRNAILVLWLREEEFADFPLPRLLMLDEILVRGFKNQTPPFKLLGPRSSNTLQAMAVDRSSWKCSIARLEGEGLLPSFMICSPEATAPDSLIFNRAERNKALRDGVKEGLRKNAHLTNFVNVIATDDILAEHLVKELKLRGVKIDVNSEDRVALIAEADTLYGRALPICFAAAFDAAKRGGDLTFNLNRIQNHPKTWPQDLLRLTYLRGLDGTTPREDSDKSVSSGSSTGLKADSERSRPPAPNRAEGDSQFDYVRRLGQLLETTANSKNVKGHATLKAVGILGSDIYDKLILLQALRPLFPEAIFFTTDLDARYLNSELYPYTRNLLVASGYGLMAEPTDHPSSPFRDCYQTAVYTGCKYLLTGGFPPSAPAPRIYEIGRTRAVAFPAPASERLKDFLLVGVISAVPIGFLLAGLWVSGVSGWIPLIPGSAHQDPLNQHLVSLRRVGRRRQVWLWIIAALLFAAVCLLATLNSARPGGEPLYFTQGVSIWPTELMRCLSVAMAISFLILAWSRHTFHRLNIWREYFGDGTLTSYQAFIAGVRPVNSRLNWARRLEISIRRWKETPTQNGTVEALALFRGYALRGRLSNRLFRSIPIAGLYMGVFFFIVMHFGRPLTPGRGALSLYFDAIILGISVVAFCVLAFYVIDAVRLTQRFILNLAAGKTSWPGPVLSKMAELRKMDPAHLDGYLDVVFTAQHTKEVYKLALYPFLVLLVMFVARNQFFDHWTWPPTLLAVFIVNAAMIFISAMSIRVAAQRVRSSAVAKLQQLQARFAGANHQWPSLDSSGNTIPDLNHPSGLKHESVDEYGKKIEMTQEEINNNSAGAYAPILQDATLTALLIPSGGIGLITLLQKLFLPS